MYELSIREHPQYLRATAHGERTPENAMRFLREAYEACVRSGRTALMLEMRLDGDSLDVSRIFALVAERSNDGMKLSKIAYVETGSGTVAKAVFAETVARNRGVNVRLFHDAASAERWLCEES